MLTKEIFKNIRRIEITTRKLVNEIFSGQYSSVFHGLGMEFAGVREYQPGDEIRTIDWNVTARLGHPYVKRFIEERELNVVLCVDASASQWFGTRNKFKSEIAAEVAAVLAFSALKNNDKVGLCIFTNEVEHFISPKKGRQHTLRIMRDILYHKPEGKGTNIESALKYLNRLLRRRSIVFLFSDFKDDGFERALSITNRKHDVIVINITDPLEQKIPAAGFLSLKDAETNERIFLDTSLWDISQRYPKKYAEKAETVDRILKKCGVDHIKLTTGESYVDPLYKFFRSRAKRFR